MITTIILLTCIIINIYLATWEYNNKNYKNAMISMFVAGFCTMSLLTTLY